MKDKLTNTSKIEWGEVGKRISELRISNNLSQAEFGKLLGVHQHIVSKLQNGESLTSEIVTNISQIFQVSTDWIYYGHSGFENLESEVTIDENINNLSASDILSNDVKKALDAAINGNFELLNYISKSRVISELSQMAVYAEKHINENKKLSNLITTYEGLIEQYKK